MSNLVNIGFGNIINAERIVTMVTPDSAPAKRIIQNAKESGKIVDATQGRRTRTVIVTDADMVVLSSLLPETIVSRVNMSVDEE